LGMTGLEEEEPQAVTRPAGSTQIREAYFVDFALAMRAKISIPLMVTGGFRQRAAMLQALESGSADLIGLGRPMCVLTDAPKLIIDGLEQLPRYEDKLSLFPTWLGWLTKIKVFKALAGFAVQYWYFEQIDTLGRTGKSDPELSVLTATKQTMKKAAIKAKGLKNSE